MSTLESNQVSISDENEARVSNESPNDSNSNDLGRLNSEIDEIRVFLGSEEPGDSRVSDGSLRREIGHFVDSKSEALLENGKSSTIGEARVFSGTLGRKIGDSVDSRDEVPSENDESGEIGETRVSRGFKRERDCLGDYGDVQSSEIVEARVFSGSDREGDNSRVLDGTRGSFENDMNGDGVVGSSDAQKEVVTSEAGTVEGSTASTSNAAREGKHMPSGKNRKLQMDGNVGQSRLERRSDVGASDVDVGGTRSMKVLDTAFEMGDMVWGKVKSHPWWPGHIFHEAFANSSVRRTRREGHVLVAFFGDSSYGWFHPLDLIPYDPNFTEKSQQTNARNFVNALEDSIEEASKRSALGLSCRCRNPHNFRPTNILGYLAVDVVDYDPDQVYSMSQIRRARESFLPNVTLSFIKQLAMAPKGDNKSLDFIKQKATALAYRRSIFEESDETYAQAFGHESVREMPQSLADTGPSRAPLSGPLVTGDAVGDRKSSIKKATKPKDMSKRHKYLLKLRAEDGDLRISQTNQVHSSFTPLSAYDDGASDSAADNYVLQKRDHFLTTNGVCVRATSDQHMTTEDSPSGLSEMSGPDISGKRPPIDTTSRLQQSEPSIATASELISVHHKTPDNHTNSVISDVSGSVKKKKVAKRPAGELSSEKSDITETRKKKIKKTDCERSKEYLERPTPGSDGTYLAKPEGQDFPQMLTVLQGLALNPFISSEMNRPAIIRKFLKFRSLVFHKATTAEPEPDDTPTEKHVIESRRKRLPSVRQEEISVKRLKKLKEVESLSAEKRALLKNAELLRRDGKVKVSASKQALLKSTKVEQHTGRRVEEPTFLMMKFQSGSSLPSLVELKARFTRFGPLDTSLSRVFYKTNTCRVAFLYKQDADVAYRYALGSKSVFSNVRFMLKPVTPPEPQQPGGGNIDPSSNLDSAAAVELQHAGSVTPPVNQQLRSCLKQPSGGGGDEPVGPTNGSGTVRAPRVRFNMDEDKDGSGSNREGGEMPMKSGIAAIPSSEDGPLYYSLPSSSVAMDISTNQRFMSSIPNQRPLVPRPPHFPNASVNHAQHNVEPPQRNDLNYNLNATTEMPGLAPVPLASLSRAPPPPLRMDISQKMMNLLTRCHDVVNSVNNILGYVPYHPL